MAEDDARDGETWYQFGFQPERKEYLALQVERPTEVGPADRRTLLEGSTFSCWSLTRFSVLVNSRSS